LNSLAQLRVQRYGLFLKPPNILRIFFRKRQKKLQKGRFYNLFCIFAPRKTVSKQ